MQSTRLPLGILIWVATVSSGCGGEVPDPRLPPPDPGIALSGEEEQDENVPILRNVSLESSNADWPQWRGPHRDGKSLEKGLLARWPKGGPKLLWKNPNLGYGYSEPAVQDGKIYILGTAEDACTAFCLDVESGNTDWNRRIAGSYANNWGGGPRGTPTVVGQRVYCLAPTGELVCLQTNSGEIVWRKHLVSDFGGQVPGWGYCESPLVDGDKVLVTPGGKNCVVALDRETGATLWTSTGLSDGAQYASLISFEVDKLPMLATMTTGGLVGLRATDGVFLWRFDKTANPTAVIPTPIAAGAKVYSTSGYGAGCGLVEITVHGDHAEAKEVYANKNMKNQHGGVILHEGHLYGYSDQVGWICQNFDDGEIVWRHTKLGKGSIAFADGRLYCYTEGEGICALVEASTKGYREAGRFTIPEKTELERGSGQIWTHPVIAEGRLFLRDQDLLFCYQVKAK